MQVTRLLKSPLKAQAYYEYIFNYEIYSLRLLGVLGTIYSLLFIGIDYLRLDNIERIVLIRGITMILTLGMIWLSYQVKLTVRLYHYGCYLFTSLFYLLGFLMDYTAGMPDFFLANMVGLYVYVFNAALGHPFKFKITQTVLVLILFTVYSQTISPHAEKHTALLWNLILTCPLSLVIGYLIERYRVLNYVQQAKLVESRKRNAELSDLKTKLITALSHDLSAPVNNITALMQLEENKLLTAQELEANKQKLKLSIDNLSIMLKNLLRWSKSHMEGFQFNRESVILKDLITEVIPSIQNQADQKNIKVINDVPAGQTLLIDPEILKIIIRNFLTNAIKYSQPEARVKVNSSTSTDFMTISVHDQGTGISTEQMNNLFTLNKTSLPGTHNESGTGVGLVITKDFAGMMGGTIHVESSLNQGSVFSVTFPIHEQAVNQDKHHL